MRAQALLVQRRRWLARERARQAVENRSSSARSLSLGLLAGRGHDVATRAKAGVTVLSPALARRFLERRAEQADPAREALAQRRLSLGRRGPGRRERVAGRLRGADRG